MSVDDTDISNALIEVDSRQRGHLSQTKYEALRDEHHPSVDEIVAVAGERSWSDMKISAGVDVYPHESVASLSIDEASRAVMEVSERVEGELTLSEYDRHRDDEHPHGSTIARTFGWTAVKRMVGLDHRQCYTSITRETSASAMREVSKRVDGRMTIEEYDEARDDCHPSGHGISSKFGWEDMREFAGLS